jgi:dTDP-glucose pyrophosphorylase
MNILIPMAGLGSRFKRAGFLKEKPLIKFNGKTLIEHSVETLGIDGRIIFVTRKYEDREANKELSSVLSKIKKNHIEIVAQKPTSGAAETALLAKKYINNNEPLIISNCDQLMDWNHELFINEVMDANVDGAVVTHTSTDPKHSYAKTVKSRNSNKIAKIVEKELVSDMALTGIHFWKSGADFVESAQDLVMNYENLRRKECFISETYNILINKGKNIIAHHVPENSYTSLGTPKDLKTCLGKIKEFKSKKPKTIFCDIDGTILSHAHCFSELKDGKQIPLNKTLDKFDEWDSLGHKIILCTARKESARATTEKHLTSLGFCWDELIMGVTSGDRVLINDKLKPSDKDRAIAINSITNKGFSQEELKKAGL